MRPIQSPPGTNLAPAAPPPRQVTNQRRRRHDLTLPLPQRDTSLAVPLPLPPPGPSSAQSSSAHSAAQQLINFSELERSNRIGSGAGGTVYKVIHRPTGRLYALKVIYGNHEIETLRQICREIEILRDVDNPNVVKCHDLSDHNGEIQVLLEYMDGGSLEGQHIGNERALSDLARQILSGLAYLHRRKIVHRDIKPSNLLINARKQVKIADFGVSRVLAQTMDPCNSSVGTIDYMSPERINTDLNHGQYDGYAGDIWSLGVSILEFYMGRFPFSVGRQGDWATLMWAICMSAPPEAPATASREFRHFISCCLQREPSKRLSAAQLLQHPFISGYGGGGSFLGGGGSNVGSNKGMSTSSVLTEGGSFLGGGGGNVGSNEGMSTSSVSGSLVNGSMAFDPSSELTLAPPGIDSESGGAMVAGSGGIMRNESASGVLGRDKGFDC